MGHALGDQADAAVKKSKKKAEVKNRTEAEIVRDIEVNLNAGLSVVPNDIRFLLNYYKKMTTPKAAYATFVVPPECKIRIIDNLGLDTMTNEGGPDGGNDSSRSGEESSGEEERSVEGSVAASESGE